MQNLEELKQELINQKDAIIKKGGKVLQANSNPSPSEITNGIKSIVSANIDFSLATATPEDVLEGKTYFGSDGEIKTGIFQELAYTYFIYDPDKMDPETKYTFKFKDDTVFVKSHLFYHFPSIININMSPHTKIIEDFAFFNTNQNITIDNFNDLTELKEIGNSGLSYVHGIDMSALPNLTKIDQSGLYNSYYGQHSLHIPSSLQNIQQSCFANSSKDKPIITDLVWPISEVTKTPNTMFGFVCFDTEMVIPSNITVINSQFLYGAYVKRITFPAGLKTLGASSLFCPDSPPVKEYAVFLGETPPTGASTFTASHQKNSFPIYVPDNSLDEYKSSFANYNILPMSQKP